MKIEDAIQDFATYVTTERRLSPGTTEYYIGEVEGFASYLAKEGVFDVEKIEAYDIRQWQMNLMQDGMSPGTVKKKLAALRAWFKYLRRQKVFERDIMAKITPPKMPKRLPIFFKEKEVEGIYADIYPDTFDGELEKLVLRMLYETGVRRSELASLTIGNVDLSGLGIKVHGKRNKDRVIPIESELAHELEHYISLRKEVVADDAMLSSDAPLLVNGKGKAVSVDKIYTIVRRYMSSRTCAERVSPHVFRHTFATHILNEGANIGVIKELLGHSSLSSTEIYTHVTRQHLKETYKHAHPRATKK